MAGSKYAVPGIRVGKMVKWSDLSIDKFKVPVLKADFA